MRTWHAEQCRAGCEERGSSVSSYNFTTPEWGITELRCVCGQWSEVEGEYVEFTVEMPCWEKGGKD